ncbi:hypothetical protein NE236_39345 [Actinoallomurus purpureus]|uniref:hypothetical protein n=1 Tax=Actinoallomurus purpureus TaxID=478114 RepID=UPI002092DE81|nr:hypothetical protein [Actinoallomurus purpureus]MCO6011029.1 hypothetical protein [Actinoallomurus purpureus]
MATAKKDARGGAAERRSARERLAAERAAAERRQRRRRILTWTASGVVAALVAGGVWAATSGGGSGKAKTTASGATGARDASAAATGLPPWPRPDDTADRARTEGLAVAPMEGTAQHFHTHLDILVDGKAVPVPANLGIAASGNAMSELHTHDTTGVLHIEAPTTGKHYTLRELFTEWNVRLGATGLGGLKPDGSRTLTAYVDGKKQAGDPATIELTPHREIALVYGPANAAVQAPSRYDFPDGE